MEIKLFLIVIALFITLIIYHGNFLEGTIYHIEIYLDKQIKELKK